MFNFNFEAILSATEARNSAPVIVAENHNVSSIAIGDADRAGSSVEMARLTLESLKNGGAWDSLEYGVSRETQIARLEAIVNDPELAEKELMAMTQRAINRASLDVTGGRVSVMTVVGDNENLPWHRLGTMVRSAVNSADARKLANIDWKVSLAPASYLTSHGMKESKSAFVIYREDTGAELGVTGSKYTPHQNEEGFAFMDEVLGEFGARYETAGAIFGGKQVWMQAHLPRNRFSVQSGDEIEPYVIFTLDHTGKGSNKCYPTTQRVVCANTFRVSQGEKDKGIRIPHFPNIQKHVQAAKQALGIAVRSIETFQEAAAEMVKTKVDVKTYVNGILDACLEVTEADAAKGADVLAAAIAKTEADRIMKMKKFEKEIEKRDSIMEEIFRRHEGEKCSPQGTLWGAFNAVTEFVDHTRQRRFTGDEKDSRRFEHMLVGDGDTMKQVAYTSAVNAMKA